MEIVSYNSRYHIIRNYDMYVDDNFEDYNLLCNDEHLGKIADMLLCFVDEGEAILFPITEEFYKEKWVYREFIEINTVFISDEYIPMSIHRKDKSPLIRWYKASDKLRIVQALKYDYWFNCIIVSTAMGLKKVSYEFEVDENNECDRNDLCIKDNKEGFLFKKVIPKLKELFGDKLQIINQS